MDLAGVVFVPEIPWGRLDAGAVPQLRSPRRRLRRLPLPSFLAGRGRYGTDPACSLAPSHSIVEAAVREANSDADVAQPSASSSFVQLQKLNTELWSYRTNPE